MKRALLAGLVSTGLLVAATGCRDTPITPQSQCQDGSDRTRVNGHKKIKEHCSNGEWIKVKNTPPPTPSPIKHKPKHSG